MSPFHQILGNNLVANVTNFTVWFAITFWVYLETHSVFATGMIAGIYLVLTAAFGIWFGSIVDHNAKKLAMLGSSVGNNRRASVSLTIATKPDVCRSRSSIERPATIGMPIVSK